MTLISISLDHNLCGIDPCLLTILSFDLCTCKVLILLLKFTNIRSGKVTLQGVKQSWREMCMGVPFFSRFWQAAGKNVIKGSGKRRSFISFLVSSSHHYIHLCIRMHTCIYAHMRVFTPIYSENPSRTEYFSQSFLLHVHLISCTLT